MRLAGYDGRIVKKIDEPSRMLGQERLLFGAFDDGREMCRIRLFELLASLCRC